MATVKRKESRTKDCRVTLGYGKDLCMRCMFCWGRMIEERSHFSCVTDGVGGEKLTLGAGVINYSMGVCWRGGDNMSLVLMKDVLLSSCFCCSVRALTRFLEAFCAGLLLNPIIWPLTVLVVDCFPAV